MERTGNQDTFRDLALALTDEERRSLHQKISTSLSLKPTDDQKLSKHLVPQSELHDIIMEEIARLSFWRRMRFLLRRLFSPKPHDQAFIDFRLAELRRRVRSVCPAMSPVENHSISAEVAIAAWPLYQAAYPLIPVFLDMWRPGKYLQESIEYLLGKQIPSARTELSDFASMEELQDAFMENELKGDVRRLVVERMGLYLDDIPDDLFVHLETGVLPFYYLRPLCLLDFNGFFETFGFDPGMVPPESLPMFKTSPTSAALPMVERLFYGLHSASRLSKGFQVHMELLDRYLDLKQQEELEDGEPVALEEEGPEVVSPSEPEAESDVQSARRKQVQQLRTQLEQLHAAAVRLAAHIPFPELVRFYRKDPWHRIEAYIPKLRLRDFHQSFLTMRVLSQLDQSFGEVRIGVIARMTEELFGSSSPSFEYFRPAVLSPPDKLGLPRFRYVRSATVFYNFLRLIYRRKMQDTLRILSRVLPVRQRDSSSALISHVAGIEQALSDLIEFDRSFAPDSDDGKSFFRVRYGVEKDITLHRTFRNIVQQRDREVRTMIDTGLEHVTGLYRVFGNLQRTLSDQVRQRYSEADPSVSALDGLDGLLEDFSGKIEQLEKLMKQILAMEEGY